MPFEQYLIRSPFLHLISINEKNCIIDNFLVLNKQNVDTEFLKLLDFCTPKRSKSDILSYFPVWLVNKALEMRLLLPYDTIFNPNAFEFAEIEINTNCNYRCAFCPTSIFHKDTIIQPIDSFELIIQRIKEGSCINSVSFAFYNEPLMDPFFEKRVELLNKYGMSLILHTNASLLSKEKVDFLRKMGNVETININFPYYDKEKYKVLTGADVFELVCQNVEYAIDSGIYIDFSVQKSPYDDIENIRIMNEKYSCRIGHEIRLWNTVDRAGLLDNYYKQSIRINGELAGCRRILKWLTVDINGNCIICCHDYHSKYSFGNLIENNLNAIINGSAYSTMIRTVFGNQYSVDYICKKCYEMKVMQVYKKMDKFHSNNY